VTREEKEKAIVHVLSWLAAVGITYVVCAIAIQFTVWYTGYGQ
jgi:hypothetical protein